MQITDLASNLSSSEFAILGSYTPLDSNSISTKLNHFDKLEDFANILRQDIVRIFKSAFDVSSVKIEHDDISTAVMNSINNGEGTLAIQNVEDLQVLIDSSDSTGYNHDTAGDTTAGDRTPEALFIENDVFRFIDGVDFQFSFRVPDYNPMEIYSTTQLYSAIAGSGFDIFMKKNPSYTQFKIQMLQNLYIIVQDEISASDTAGDSAADENYNLPLDVTAVDGYLSGATGNVYDVTQIGTRTLIHTFTTDNFGKADFTITQSSIRVALVIVSGGTNLTTGLPNVNTYENRIIVTDEMQVNARVVVDDNSDEGVADLTAVTPVTSIMSKILEKKLEAIEESGGTVNPVSYTHLTLPTKA